METTEKKKTGSNALIGVFAGFGGVALLVFIFGFVLNNFSMTIESEHPYTKSNQAIISGKAKGDNTSLKINGINVPIVNGKYKHTITLKDGENTLIGILYTNNVLAAKEDRIVTLLDDSEYAYYKKCVEEKKEYKSKQLRYLESKFGIKPTSGEANTAVKALIEAAAKDPSSIVYESISDVRYNDASGWMVECAYRGKNSFGGYVRDIKWFILKRNANNIVYAMPQN